jgi:hypothetical protein
MDKDTSMNSYLESLDERETHSWNLIFIRDFNDWGIGIN